MSRCHACAFVPGQRLGYNRAMVVSWIKRALGIGNPLAARLARRAGCLGSRVALLAAVGLGVMVSALMVGRVAGHDPDAYYVAVFLTLVTWLSLPIFVAYVAASVAVRYGDSFEYPLLCATTLSDARIVQGYVIAALHICRPVLGLMVALTPMTAYALLDPGPGSWREGFRSGAEGLDALAFGLQGGLIALMLAGLLLGVNLLASALGVWFGAWWRSLVLAATAALLLTAGLMIALLHWVDHVATRLQVPDGFPGLMFCCGWLNPLVYASALAAMRLARRWARSERLRGGV